MCACAVHISQSTAVPANHNLITLYGCVHVYWLLLLPLHCYAPLNKHPSTSETKSWFSLFCPQMIFVDHDCKEGIILTRLCCHRQNEPVPSRLPRNVSVTPLEKHRRLHVWRKKFKRYIFRSTPSERARRRCTLAFYCSMELHWALSDVPTLRIRHGQGYLIFGIAAVIQSLRGQ